MQPQPTDEEKTATGDDPLIGRILNERYQILEVIGLGGMATVYKAVQSQLDRVVALKVLNHHYAVHSDPNFLRRFLREANLSSKLRHPNTVTVLDYGHTDDGVYYIAMEYLEGETLAKRISTLGVLPWSEAVDLAQQIARSLREAHRMGIVHRDLKPANVMLLTEGDHVHLKVLDFGLVKPVPGGAEGGPELTAHGMFLGSPTYMAPEQSRNYSDIRSDVYSLGVVFYQMLTGRPPFMSKDYLEIINLHYKQRPENPRTLRPDLNIPQAVEDVVLRCLRKNPEQRFQDMDGLLEALKDVGARAVVSAAPAAEVTSTSATLPGAGMPTSFDIRISDAGLRRVSALRSAPTHKAWRWAFAGALVVLSMAVSWGVLEWLATRELPGPDLAKPVGYLDTERAAVAPAAAVKTPELVKFRLSTEPPGADVFHGGQRVGTTPMTLHMPADESNVARVEVTFKMKGYLSETVIAGGQGQVLLTQRLQKSGASKTPAPPAPPRAEGVLTDNVDGTTDGRRASSSAGSTADGERPSADAPHAGPVVETVQSSPQDVSKPSGPTVTRVVAPEPTGTDAPVLQATPTTPTTPTAPTTTATTEADPTVSGN